MGEMVEIFGAMKEHRREERLSTLERNMEILFESEFNFPRRFDYRKADRVVLFREKGKPAVNFYPSGNSWVVNNRKKHGDAKAFLEWYRKQ